MGSDPKVRKALVIGLDGVPYSLLKDYLDQGRMPRLGSILSQGYGLHSMNASIPDVSSVSWTSFATGVNPGEHGIFGFLELRPEDYSIYFPNARDVQAPSFWEILGKTDRKTSTLGDRFRKKVERPHRSIIFNLPHTYPATALYGILVSGFVAIDLKKAIYPDSIYPFLNSIRYKIDVDAEMVQTDKARFLHELFECFEIRKNAIDHFFLQESWDLFLACVTETDRLHHFFFDAARDQGHPFYTSFIQFYEALDEWIHRMYEKFMAQSKGEGLFLVLSDHGFEPLKKEVYINPFLERSGFLKRSSEGDFFKKLAEGTRAFNLDPCRIYLHYKGVYARGTVDRRDRSVLLEEVRDALKTLRDENNEAVIEELYFSEEIYSGPQMGRAPDLVCLPRSGFDLKGGIDRKEVFGKTHFTGMHSRHDAFCMVPEALAWVGKPSIEQVTEILLRYFTS